MSYSMPLWAFLAALARSRDEDEGPGSRPGDQDLPWLRQEKARPTGLDTLLDWLERGDEGRRHASAKEERP